MSLPQHPGRTRTGRPTRVPPASGGDPQPAREESWITFLSRRTGDKLLYRMRPDGTQCTANFGGTVKDIPGMRDWVTLYREPHWTWQSPD